MRIKDNEIYFAIGLLCGIILTTYVMNNVQGSKNKIKDESIRSSINKNYMVGYCPLSEDQYYK